MEFVEPSDVAGIFEDNAIKPGAPDGGCIHLEMDAPNAVRFHLATTASEATPDDGAESRTVDAEGKLGDFLEGALQRLHIDQILLVPLGEWGKVFDAIAFSLAENEDWQDFDTAATVERNTRDPILCMPADFTTLMLVFAALWSDAESRDQGVHIVATATQLLMEVDPTGCVRVTCGTQVVADELRDIFESF
ncbi:MAG: hypothetical protein AB8G96_12050 [Phycisphaerales bacterium]